MFKVTANDFQEYIVLLGSSYFSKKPGIVDGTEKAFSSSLKGAGRKNFSGGGAPRPPFCIFHFNMNPVIGDVNRGPC